MSRTIPYDRSRRALYTPCADAIALDESATRSEALLCAELSRLVYCPFERDPATQQAVEDQLAGVGFRECIFFKETSAQAFLAINATKNLGVLAFRGTQANEWQDILTDLKALLWPWAGAGWVHRGFAKKLAGVWPDILVALNENPGVRMLYTGHSLGAALATLSAALRPPAALYTFGSPRVGNATFGASIAGVTHERFVDCADGVCQVPSLWWFYRHVGTRKYIDQNGALQDTISDADIASDQRSAAISYPREIGPNVLLRSAADHAPVNYIYALRANQ